MLVAVLERRQRLRLHRVQKLDAAKRKVPLAVGRQQLLALALALMLKILKMSMMRLHALKLSAYSAIDR